MLSRNRASVACVLALIGVVAASAQTDLQVKASALMKALAAHQFGEAENYFDANFRAAEPVDKLAAIWNTVVSQNGDFKSVLGTRQQGVLDAHIVYVTCQFERKNVEVQVVFDSNGLVSFFYIPAKYTSDTAKPADFAGDWIGMLLGLERHSHMIVFHITSTENGLTATVDDPDHSLFGVPVSSVNVSNATLRLESETLSAVYEAKISSDLSVLGGPWKQGGMEQFLIMKRVKDKAELQQLTAADITGDWLGTLEVGATRLRIVFHISKNATGLTATIDSPDQNASGLPPSIAQQPCKKSNGDDWSFYYVNM